jgi:hypothetical protein
MRAEIRSPGCRSTFPGKERQTVSIENQRLAKEVAELRQQIAAFERSRWWRLHPRFLLSRLARGVSRGRRAPSVSDTAVDASFDATVFATLRLGAQRSAAVVVPLVQDIVRAGSVIDVGGGEGWWAEAFARLGAHAVSIDEASPSELAEGVQHVQHDLRRGLPESLGPFDLALCLEVVEHFCEGDGDKLVEGLCSLAPVVLFSAAVPGQGGHGHVNERWPAYWFERFEQHDFRCSGALRWRIWNDERVEPWYRQNLLFATSEPRRFPTLYETPLAEPWPVVHPATFGRRRDSGRALEDRQ